MQKMKKRYYALAAGGEMLLAASGVKTFVATYFPIERAVFALGLLPDFMNSDY